MENMEILSCVLILLLRLIKCSSGECQLIAIENGHSKLRMRGRVSSFYCDSGYQLYGDKTTYCQNGRWTNSVPFCIAPGCNTDITIENGVITMSYNNSVMTIGCMDKTILEGSMVLLCNGTQWNREHPKCKDPKDIEACDFENEGLCGWKQDRTDKFDWTRHSGATVTGRTGPDTDHTFQSKRSDGHYIYMEASSPRRFGDATRLLSPWFPSVKSGRCFKFWYHMLGPSSKNDVGTLKVELVEGIGSYTDMRTMFWITGNQGDRWKDASFYIPNMNVSYQLILSATRLKSYVSDIAVDDLTFYSCQPNSTTTQTIMTTATTTEFKYKMSIQEQSTISSIFELNTPAAQRRVSENIPLDSSTSYSAGYSTKYETFVTNIDDDGSGELDTDFIKVTSPVHAETTSLVHILTTKAVKETFNTTSIENGLELNGTQADNNSLISTGNKSDNNKRLSDTNNTKNMSRNGLNITEFDQNINEGKPQETTTTETNDYNTTTKFDNSEIRSTNFYNEKSEQNDIYTNVTSTILYKNENETTYFEKVGLFNETLIVCLGLGVVVVTVLISVLIVIIVACRKKQKKYDDKYEEMKQFVETHYRSRYV